MVIDERQILDTRHPERTCRSLRRLKDAFHVEEAITLRGLYEEVFLRRSHFFNQGSERVGKSIQLLRIVLIHAGHVTAELRSAGPGGSTGVLAQTNIHGFKRSIELTKRNGR